MFSLPVLQFITMVTEEVHRDIDKKHAWHAGMAVVAGRKNCSITRSDSLHEGILIPSFIPSLLVRKGEEDGDSFAEMEPRLLHSTDRKKRLRVRLKVELLLVCYQQQKITIFYSLLPCLTYLRTLLPCFLPSFLPSSGCKDRSHENQTRRSST